MHTRFVSVFLGLFAFCESGFAEERRFVLTSAADKINRTTFQLREGSENSISDRWKVELETLHGGRQEGVRLIHIDNGRLRVVVVPTRGMSILSVHDSTTGDRIFGWDSPVKEVVHPAYVDLESRGGLGWLEGFNEWMVRCGLEFAGHPGVDKFTTNTGSEAEMMLTLHGKIGNIPASEVELFIDDAAPYQLRLRGVVHERLFFGPKLQLTTELVMSPNSASISLVDEVTNHGSEDQEFQLIYHANFGAPLLQAGAHVVAAAKTITPMNETATAGIDSYATYAGPTPGYTEQVFLIEPVADASKMTSVVLHNREGDRGAEVRWSPTTLPYLTIWKNTVAEADGYVTGIEPATGYPFNRRVERKHGRVPKLGPGRSRSFAVTFTALSSTSEVNEAVAAVTALQDQQGEAVVVRQPPSTDFDQ